MDWYFRAFRNYSVFSGRARRKEFWYFFLFSGIALVLLQIIDASLGTLNEDHTLGAFSGLYLLAALIPYLSVAVRRFHDTNRSGWWLLITLVPVVGMIIFLILMLRDGDSGENRFGPSPKSANA